MDVPRQEQIETAMKLRQLGSSDTRVAPLGLGGNVFGYFSDRDQTQRTMDVALDNGINYVDTADVYSDGESEMLIGASIKATRTSWFVATKAGVTSDGSNRGLGRRKNILSKVDASLKRLGTDYIDLYQMHHYDPMTPLEETLETLNELVQQGKILHAGVSNYTGAELRRANELSKINNTAPIVSVQNLYHLLKRDIEEDLIPPCQDTGTSVVVYGVLARGILSGKYSSATLPPSGSRAESSNNVRGDLEPEVLSVVQSLHEFAQKRGKTATQLAVAWVLRLSEISTVLIGIRNGQQLLDILPGSDWIFDEDELSEIDRLIGDTSRFNHLALGSQFRPN
jgi:aryl-alcohol dehydrogenase-like predicted oxidoreductase